MKVKAYIIDRLSVPVKCGISLTQQHFKEECDINTIVRRYAVTGVMPNVNPKPPIYGDFSEVPDYQAAFAAVAHAGELFASLPSAVRDRFGNDPARMIAFLQDSANRAEAEKLGLIEPAKASFEAAVEQPAVTPVTPATPGASTHVDASAQL